MQLAPFRLDHWMEQYKAAGIAHDLSGSTGPRWRYAELLHALGPEVRAALSELPLAYSVAAGRRELLEAIGRYEGVTPEAVLVTTGASEAFHIIAACAAEPGGNVVVPSPAFPPLVEIPRSLGLEVRTYALRRERRFEIDLDEVAARIDARTRFLLVNSPHNPTGGVVAPQQLAQLHALAARQRVTLVSDQVYWPLAFAETPHSATSFPDAVVVGSLSKAISLSGLRIGWIVDRDPARRERHLNAKMYFTISSSPVSELLAAAALARAETFLERTRRRCAENLRALVAILDRNADLIGYVPPRGGTTAFPWLTFTGQSRPFCEALARDGVLVSPGDCFDAPQHLRIGFGSAASFPDALLVFEAALRRESSTA